MKPLRCATVVLNRNLPKQTDALVEHLNKYDGLHTDIFVLEAGSNPKNLSKYVTWHINDFEANRHGLRFSRGMNQALLNIYKDKALWSKYDYFFLLTNNVHLKPKASIAPLVEIFQKHPKLGILSPCGEDWGEKLIIPENQTKYVWTLFNNTICISKAFVEAIMVSRMATRQNFIFDGNNFRGYLMDSELVAKAYVNNFAVAITTKVIFSKDESRLLELSDLANTETYSQSIRAYISEGEEWLHAKYGFSNRWAMNNYVRYLYQEFLRYNKDCEPYQI